MDLTDEQYKDIEELAGINYSVEKIAMYLDVDLVDFEQEFNTPGSKIRHHYDRGQLMVQAEIDKQNLNQAKSGNLTSIQQWKKDSLAERLENYKLKIQFDSEKTQYGQLQAMVERGETNDLPAPVVEYFEQIDYIRCLFNKFNSKSYIVSAISLKWPNISKYKANKLYCESLNFFNLDNEIKVQAWSNIYADRLDNMALIAQQMNDFETARRCFKDAAEMRGVGKDMANQVPEDLLDRRPVLYTMKMRDAGAPEINRNELGRLLDQMDITVVDRSRINRDARTEDIPFILFEDESKEDNQAGS